MGSGEGDAIKYVYVDNTNPPNGDSYYEPSITLPLTKTYSQWDTNTSNNMFYNYTAYRYKYQIKCPAKSCKTMNWMELDTITPCVKCGLKLKAVSEQADFEIEVTG